MARRLEGRPLAAREARWLERGASGKIDLGARLGPVLTACIGVTTRGVRASHSRHRVPGPATPPGADVRALRHSRSRKLGEERLQLCRDEGRLATVISGRVAYASKCHSLGTWQNRAQAVERCRQVPGTLGAAEQKDLAM